MGKLFSCGKKPDSKVDNEIKIRTYSHSHTQYEPDNAVYVDYPPSGENAVNTFALRIGRNDTIDIRCTETGKEVNEKVSYHFKASKSIYIFFFNANLLEQSNDAVAEVDAVQGLMEFLRTGSVETLIPVEARKSHKTTSPFIVGNSSLTTVHGRKIIWVSAKNGEIPPNAVQGGLNNGQPIYVARAYHKHALTPGTLIPGNNATFISWEFKQHEKEEYEVLCTTDECKWVPTVGNDIPDGPLPAGETEDKEPLYVGRVNFGGSDYIGKVQLSRGVLYIPYFGVEESFTDYEILVV